MKKLKRELETNLEEICEVLGARGAMLWVYDSEVEALQVIAGYGVRTHYINFGNQAAQREDVKQIAPVYRSWNLGLPPIHFSTDKSKEHELYEPLQNRMKLGSSSESSVGEAYCTPVETASERLGVLSLYFETLGPEGPGTRKLWGHHLQDIANLLDERSTAKRLARA